MSKTIFEILKDVLSDQRLTAFDKNVFSCLLTYNGKGRIFPTRNEIMNRLNSKNLPTISISVNKLQEAGHIEIIRRKQQSNIYILKGFESKIKTKEDKSVLPKKKEIIEADPLKFMNKAIIDVTAEQVAEAFGRSKTESSDYSFVNKLLKIKETDEFKKDCMNTVRKCLMLLYLIKTHSDKFKTDYTYPYFVKVFSTSSYSQLRSKIFEPIISNNKIFKPDTAIIKKPSLNY